MGTGFYIDKEIKLLNTIDLAFEKYKKDVKVRSPYAPGTANRLHGLIDSELVDLQKHDNDFKLDASLKNQFERAFGTDLSSVHLHTGVYADAISKKMDADAVTIGEDIYFAQGKYLPDTEEGIELMAHELEHVIQYLNNKRLVYYEDIDKAEHEASLVENAISSMRLHNIEAPLLSQSETPTISSEQTSTDSDVLLTKSKSPESENIDDFAGRSNKPVYEIKLKNGKTVHLSKNEKEILYNEFKKKVIGWFQKIKNNYSEDEYSKRIVHFMNLFK